MLPYLRLMRLPTVFTALSNILCGYFLTHSISVREVFGEVPLGLLLLASAGLYLGGMVLNDVCDAGLDALERPERPIPSGQVSRTAAVALTVLLMSGGLMAAAQVSRQSLQIGMLLTIMIAAYNLILKHSLLGSPGMGICRFLNLMLGASAANGSVWGNPQLGIAAGLFVYICGVTWFARHEAGQSASRQLIIGLLTALTGLIVDAVVIGYSDFPERPTIAGWVGLTLIAANLTVRTSEAIADGQPRRVQRTVGLMLLTLIFMDATIVFAAGGDSSSASLVMILLIPAILLKRVIPMS